LKKNDGEKNIIRYGNAGSILSVLSVVAAFVVVCIAVIFILARLDVIAVPGFISGEKETEPSPAETEGQNLLDALIGGSDEPETVDVAVDAARLKQVLAVHKQVSPYAVTGTITYAGEKYSKNLNFFACVYGEKYRVDVYDGAALVRSTVYDGTTLAVTDGSGVKYLENAEYFTSDTAVPVPSIKRLCADDGYEFVSAYIEAKTGNCVCRGRYTDRELFDDLVISTEYGIVTSADTYADGRLIYSCRVNLITTNIPDPDSIIGEPTK